jgi:Lysyl oxidase
VVDGFRRDGEAVMDAYQYFYDADGEAVGYAEVGEMEWDTRDGHHHWHFLDFARYRLLDADKSSAARSMKQSFCLANTDAVDYTVPGADWLPYNTDLHSSCGGREATSVREGLAFGSGDTYFQYLPGQSFNITSLPNGTYYVEVTANPLNRLYESGQDQQHLLPESSSARDTARSPGPRSAAGPGERLLVRIRSTHRAAHRGEEPAQPGRPFSLLPSCASWRCT